MSRDRPAQSVPADRGRPRGTGRREAGQASIEYAGLLAVLAAVLVLGVSLVGGGAIFNGVLGGIQRALCLVTGGACDPPKLEACTISSRETGGTFGVKLTFVKLGRSLSLLREEKSDGSVDITLVDGTDAAATAAVGAAGGVRLGKGRRSLSAMAEAELLVRLGRSDVWHRPDKASADRLVERIAKRVAVDKAADVATSAVPLLRGPRHLAHLVGVDADKLPVPDEQGLDAGLEGAASVGLGDVVSVNAGLGLSLGGSRERASGRMTFVLGVDGGVGAALTKATGGGELSGAGDAALEITLDKRGTPVELVVSWAGSGSSAAGLELPQGVEGGRSGRTETRTTLDLTRPANRAAYYRLVHGLTPKGALGLPGAIAGLAEQLRSDGRGEFARHTTDETVYGAEAEAALGARVGLAAEVTRSSTKLQDAWTRPPGGVWELRTDCLSGARRA